MGNILKILRVSYWSKGACPILSTIGCWLTLAETSLVALGCQLELVIKTADCKR